MNPGPKVDFSFLRFFYLNSTSIKCRQYCSSTQRAEEVSDIVNVEVFDKLPDML